MPASPASAYPRRHGAPVATAQAGHGRDGRLTGAHPTTTKSLNTPAPPPPRLATASQSRPIPSAPRTPPSGPTASRSHPPGTPKKTAEHAASSHGQHPDQHVRDLRSRTGHQGLVNESAEKVGRNSRSGHPAGSLRVWWLAEVAPDRGQEVVGRGSASLSALMKRLLATDGRVEAQLCSSLLHFLCWWFGGPDPAAVVVGAGPVRAGRCPRRVAAAGWPWVSCGWPEGCGGGRSGRVAARRGRRPRGRRCLGRRTSPG